MTTSIEVLNKALVGKYASADFNDYSSDGGGVISRIGVIVGVAEIEGELRALVHSNGVMSSVEVTTIFECGDTPEAITVARTETSDAA